MIKLHGKELDDELARRSESKKERRKLRKPFSVRAEELGVSSREYLDWESGRDICSHEEYRKTIVGFHPPFLLMEICTKCRHPKIIAKIETSEDVEEHKKDFEEAAKNIGWIKEKEK